MFGWGRKEKNVARDGLRQDFARVTSVLAKADPSVRFVVGHSLNMANSMFVQRFRSVAEFQQRPHSEKLSFLESLGTAEKELGKQQPQAAVGFALFKMWIGAVTANDTELVNEFSKGLEPISRQGDASR